MSEELESKVAHIENMPRVTRQEAVERQDMLNGRIDKLFKITRAHQETLEMYRDRILECQSNGAVMWDRVRVHSKVLMIILAAVVGFILASWVL